MSHLPLYTAIAASILMLLQLSLMLMVGLSRGKHAQSIGDGGNPALLLAIRRHGNLAENAPIFLILLGLLEVLTGSTLIILSLACVFVAARIAHAAGLTKNAEANLPRAVGALGTLICGVVVSGCLLYASIPLVI